MGDVADQALERAQRGVDLYGALQDTPSQEQYDAGLIDETGSTIGNPSSYPGIPVSRPAPEGLWDM